ncbi:hypothetical protein [Paenibacillus sp. DMB5]|uniref:hypothetical protein n=1 Tax=Paenibacillus sp. DMB5 TaxID=1780103 RepID=UPI00076C10D5|nr:hypothetical protein [Paenibacillus sp. DMB5]KUP20452.1 hypothetical protein AWJ19_16935 [Paenibacillus sp. DMB5]
MINIINMRIWNKQRRIRKETETKIISLLKELNYKEVLINNTVVYTSKRKYLKLTFIRGLKSYVFEYADSYDEAEKNLFGDGDLFPLTMNEAEMLFKMRDEIINL